MNSPLRKTYNKLKFKFWNVGRKIRPPKYPDIEEKLIHLGCGYINHPDFINVDLRPHLHVHHLSGVENLDFFEDNFADLIYISHCLEHISFLKTVTVLKEWYRVLKPGGTLRISVPDFDVTVQMYLDNNREMNLILSQLMGGQNYAHNYHYACFNFESLSEALKEAGFHTIQKWQYGSTEYTSLPDYSGSELTIKDKTYFVSLNIEAIK